MAYFTICVICIAEKEGGFRELKIFNIKKALRGVSKWIIKKL